ncbi:hypothetical protein X975_17251, partial [Stegodyphus mimosarum]
MVDDFLQVVLEKTFGLLGESKVLRCADLMLILRNHCNIDLSHFVANVSNLSRYPYHEH